MSSDDNISTRPVSDSSVEATHLVLPSHANVLGTIFGGQLMSWIDLVAAISASRHSHNVCVTASMDRLDFHHPIRIGDIVNLRASVNFTGTSSMEVGVRVDAEDPLSGKIIRAATSYLTFVSLDEAGRPARVPKVIPDTPDEKRRYEAAQVRRAQRLKEAKKKKS